MFILALCSALVASQDPTHRGIYLVRQLLDVSRLKGLLSETMLQTVFRYLNKSAIHLAQARARQDHCIVRCTTCNDTFAEQAASCTIDNHTSRLIQFGRKYTSSSLSEHGSTEEMSFSQQYSSTCRQLKDLQVRTVMPRISPASSHIVFGKRTPIADEFPGVHP